MIESYEFSFAYFEDGVSIGLGGGKDEKISNKIQSKDEIVASMQRMIRTLVTFSQTLKTIPSSRILTMKLLYYDDITPSEYEPMYFKPLEQHERFAYGKDFVKIRVGDFVTSYHSVEVKVRTKQENVESDDEPLPEVVKQVSQPSQTEFSIPERSKPELSDSQATQLSQDEKTVQNIPDLWIRCLSYVLQQEFISNVILADHLNISLFDAEALLRRCQDDKYISTVFSKGSKGHRVLKNKHVEKKREEVFKEISHDPTKMIFDPKVVDKSPKKDESFVKSPQKKEPLNEDVKSVAKRNFGETQDPFDYDNLKISSIASPIQQKKRALYRNVGNISI
jgi:hypothetical protein